MENNKPINQNNKTNQVQPNQQNVIRNEKMAVKFPDWDLLPPSLLVRRDKHEEP